jgi:hypothetical protein
MTLADRITKARSEFDEKTKARPGEKSDPTLGIVRSFFLSIVFPQLKRSAEKDEARTFGLVVEVVSQIAHTLGVTAEECYPERFTLTPPPSSLPNGGSGGASGGPLPGVTSSN